ncbi:DNA methylase [Escherichia coli]|nr:DNA methylase [Escherichia coli]CAD5646201.1 DNA methylase [Escherichia coli]
MTSLKTSIKTITYLSDIGCLEIQGASLSKPMLNLSEDLCVTITLASHDTLISVGDLLILFKIILVHSNYIDLQGIFTA